jgi:hypothetical protein
MARELTLKKIDDAAIMWEKTKDPQYKDLWYKLIKEFADGSNYFKRRAVSVSSCHKANDGTYVIVGRSRLLQPVRNTKTKVNKVFGKS